MQPTKASILAIAAISLAMAGAASAQQQDSIEVTILPGLLEKLEESRPKEVFVYEVVPPDPGRWMEIFQRVTGVQGRVTEGKDLLETRQGKLHLEIRKVSSAAFYADLAHLWQQAPTPADADVAVPDDEATRKLARELLAKYGFGEAEAGDLEITVSDKTFQLTRPQQRDKTHRVVVGKNVEVRRRVDGLLVHGPGSKIKIYVGEKGRVDGYLAVWRQFDPQSRVLGHQPVGGERRGKAVRPISANDAFARLRKKPLDHLPLLLVDRIDIDRAEIGYYAHAATEPQRYLQPVYVFSGTAHANLPHGRESTVPFVQYVVALDEPMESIWPKTRAFKGQPGPKKPHGGEDKDE